MPSVNMQPLLAKRSAFSFTFIFNYWPEVQNEKPEGYSRDSGGNCSRHRRDLLFLQVRDRSEPCRRSYVGMDRARAGRSRLCLWSDILPGPRKQRGRDSHNSIARAFIRAANTVEGRWINLRLLTRHHIGRRLCTNRSGLRAQTALVFVKERRDSTENVFTPGSATTTTASGHAANFLCPRCTAVVDWRRRWLVDRCCARFCKIAGFRTLGALVIIC